MKHTQRPYLAYLALIGIFIGAASHLISSWCVQSYTLRDRLIQPHKKTIACALFSAQDDIANTLIELIDHEQERIQCALYLLTHTTIAQALIAAHKRGIAIDLIMHNQEEEDARISLLHELRTQGIDVRMYHFAANPAHKHPPIMHHKFFIFSSNIDNRSLVLTGSFNATHAAHTKNHENIVILDDADIIAAYKAHFATLIDQTQPLKPARRPQKKRRE